MSDARKELFCSHTSGGCSLCRCPYCGTPRKLGDPCDPYCNSDNVSNQTNMAKLDFQKGISDEELRQQVDAIVARENEDAGSSNGPRVIEAIRQRWEGVRPPSMSQSGPGDEVHIGWQQSDNARKSRVAHREAASDVQRLLDEIDRLNAAIATQTGGAG